MIRHSLENVRTDGWLEKLGEGSSSFGQLCQVMGERFVGFSVIAGLRITSVAFDARAPERSMVEVDLGDGGRRARLPLEELQDRLAEAMVDGTTAPASLPERPTEEDLQAAIGYRWVLLAALFDVRLEHLIDDEGELHVAFSYDGEEHTLGLEAFRERLREAVPSELARVRARRAGPRVGGPFAIDLALVPKALAHDQADEHAEIVTLLGGWPAALSVLLRTSEGQALAPAARDQIARALGVLGAAHVRLGRFDWGVEVMRLGVQWAQEGEPARDLFARLGRAYLEADRAGEAIGLLRRARELGAPDAVVATPLARAFAARGRHVAVLAWARRARREGLGGPELDEAEAQARRGLLAENAALDAALREAGLLGEGLPGGGLLGGRPAKA